MGKRKFWSSDKIVSFSAIFISFLTLYIFIRQTNLIEVQNHLSVMPYLMLETSDNGELHTFSIDLENYGVGPAIIEGSMIHYKGERYEMQFREFLEQNIPEIDSVVVINYTTIENGIAIPADNHRNIITAGGGRESYIRFLNILKKLEEDGFYYEIRYRSIYNDHWKITANEAVPEEL